MTTTLVSKIANAGGAEQPVGITDNPQFAGVGVGGTAVAAAVTFVISSVNRAQMSAGGLWFDSSALWRWSSGANITATDTYLGRSGVGIVEVTGGGGGLRATSHIRVPVTVATLPAAPTRGYTCLVSDASSPTFLATVAAGGTVVTPVFYDGAAWKVG